MWRGYAPSFPNAWGRDARPALHGYDPGSPFRLQKSRRIHVNPAALNYSTMSMLVFHLDTLNHALLAVAGVIYAHFLSGAQRGRNDFACRVNNAGGRAESEAHWTLTLTLHHDGFSGRVGVHGSGFVGGARLARGCGGRSG